MNGPKVYTYTVTQDLCTRSPSEIVERKQLERWVASIEPAARCWETNSPRAVDVGIVVHRVSSACE